MEIRSNDEDWDNAFKCIHKEIGLFIYLKNFVRDVNNTKKATAKVIDDYSCIKSGSKRLSEYYLAVIEKNPQRAIELMGRYLALGEKLNQLNLDPIRIFFKKDFSLDLLYTDSYLFANMVVPEIWRLGLSTEFNEMGLYIKFLDADSLTQSPKINLKLNDYIDISVSIDPDVYDDLLDILDLDYSTTGFPSYPIDRLFEDNVQYLERELEAIQ
jgi:hypothetical protein